MNIPDGAAFLADEFVPIHVLVLQPTSFCNIDCRYCYVPGRNNTRKMDDDTLLAVALNILHQDFVGSEITLSWHSGEPLVLPVSYYENAFSLLRRAAPQTLKLNHFFQTNGTLVTPEWAHFFLRNDIAVGVSLDGPEELHDSARRTRRDTGTYASVMRGLDTLRSAGLTPSVICVLNDKSLQRPDELFHFFENHNVHRIAFNVQELVGAQLHTAGTATRRIAFERFLEAYLGLMIKHKSAQRLREIQSVASRMFAKRPQPVFGSLLRPFGHVSVDVDGRFWTFSPELGFDSEPTRFFLGNCREVSIAMARKSPQFTNLVSEISRGVRNCEAGCDYFYICGGGSPAHKYAEQKRFDVTETEFCRTNIQAVANVLSDFALRGLSGH